MCVCVVSSACHGHMYKCAFMCVYHYQERRKHEETQDKVRHYSNSSEDLEARRRTLERMHSQLTEDHANITEELRSTRENLRMKEQVLLANTQKQDELRFELETVKMNNQQLNEQLNTTSRNLDQALDR